MKELIIHFGKATEEGAYPLSINRKRVGQFEPPLSDDALEVLIVHLQAPLPLEERTAWGDRLYTHGQGLFKNLILDNAQVQEAWEGMPDQARLILSFEKESTELLRLPWEYLTDLDGEPLATQRPLVRRIAGLKTKKLPALEGRPLRLLVVIAEPADQPRFGARHVYDLLLQELSPLAEQGVLEIEFMSPPASPERLSARLTERRYDILHFVCHGLGDTLALEGEYGDAREVKASKVRTLLRGKRIRLILLTSCLTGAVEEDLRSGVATTLLEAGVPEVVAMQFPAFVDPALKFVGDIYRAMTGDWRASIDEAVLLARRGGFFDQQESVYQWGVPVVYLQDEGLTFCAQVPGGEPLDIEEWPPVTQNNLPHQENFIGRGNEMVELMKALAAQRLVAITGTGGIGKTELAKAVGHYLAARGRYEGGIIWADLEQAKDLNLLLSALASALNTKLDPATEPLEQLSQWLRDWPGLLILDNLDTALDAPEKDEVRKAFTKLRQGTKAPRFLITSRTTLQVGEQHVQLWRMKLEEGALLFALHADLAGGQVRETDWDTLLEIIKLLDNYPLAIVLAAPQLAESSPATLLKDLQEKKTEVLQLPTREKPTRLDSLEVSLGLSYDRRSVGAQRLFAVLSVFLSGVQAFSLDEVWGEGWRQPMGELLRRSLAELVLVPWVKTPERYMQLVPVREYAAAKLPEDELEEYRSKAAEHYLNVARTCDEMLKGEQAPGATMLMELELPNMRAGMDWAGREMQRVEPEDADRDRLQLVVGYAFRLDEFLDRRGYWNERIERVKRGVKACEILGEDRDLAALKGNLAASLRDLGQVGEADRLRQEVEAIMRKKGGKDWATYLLEHGVAAQHRGDYREARGLYGESLKIDEELGDKSGIAISLHQLGTLAQDTGDYDEARRLYGESLKLSQELGDKSGIASTLHNLAALAQDRGDYGEARRLYGESLKMNEELGDRSAIAKSLHQLGMLAQDTGDYGEARRLYGESLKMDEELGDKSGIASTLHNLAALAQDRGDYDEARRLYGESLKMNEELGDRSGIAKSLHNLAALAQVTGDYGEARRLYGESLKMNEELGDRSGIAKSLHQLGMLAQDTGDYGEARRLYGESLNIDEELGDRSGIAQTLGQLGMLAQDEGRLEEAVVYWVQAAAIFQQLGSPDLQKALTLLAAAQKELGEQKFRQIVERAQKGRPSPDPEE